VRARGRCWKTGIVPALVLLLGTASGSLGQVTAVPQKDLAFGVLTPGVSNQVQVTDAARRAEWLLTGRGNTTVSFVLPSALEGPGGALLPLVFASGDAAWQRQSGGGGGGGLQPQDPRTPFSVNVPNPATVRLYLGGTAQPATTQPAGTYTATVTVIIAQP
jgi:hypothetical protein